LLVMEERLPRWREPARASGAPSRVGWCASAWNDALPERQGVLVWEGTFLGLPPAPVVPNAALQARGIAGARHERTLFPVALQAFVRCFPSRYGGLCHHGLYTLGGE